MRIATCVGCGRPQWTSFAIVGEAKSNRHGIHDGDYCGDCFEKYDLERRPPRQGTPASRDETSPGWDDAVRASEEDR